MKRLFAVLVGVAVLAAGLAGIAIANTPQGSALTGLTGCLTPSGDLTNLAIGEAPLESCAPDAHQVSVPVFQASTPSLTPSLACVVDKATVTWDKSGVWAEFDLEWANLVGISKIVLSWEADHPLPSSEFPDTSLSEVSGDWTYANNGVDDAGLTITSESGSGSARLHLGSGNPSTSGSAPITSMMLIPPDGIYLCSSGGGL